MDQALLQKMNEQIAIEIGSANLYLNMSTYFELEGLDGMAHWLYVQHLEEMDHAMKLYHHIIDRGEAAVLMQIDQPDNKFASVLDVWKKGLEHEKMITAKFYDMMTIALENKEYKSISLLQWFVDEQVEEENNFSGIVDKIEYADSAKPAIMQMNGAMASRVYNPLPGGMMPAQGQ